MFVILSIMNLIDCIFIDEFCFEHKKTWRILSMDGIIIGVIAFILIGIFHPLVIWGEYYFGRRCWPVFLLVGIICLAVSTFVQYVIASAVLGITGMCCLWSILELKQQEKRVAKGWFPKREDKKDDEERTMDRDVDKASVTEEENS